MTGKSGNPNGWGDNMLRKGRDHYENLDPELVATLDPTARHLRPVPKVIERGVCDSCGWVHTMCRAHRKNTKGQVPCHKAAVKGQYCCVKHFGATRNHVKGAEDRAQEAAVNEAIKTFGLPIDVDPTEAMYVELCRCAGVAAWAYGRCQELAPDVVVWGKSSTERGRNSKGEVDVTKYSADTNAWIDLYERFSDRVVRIAATAVKAGLEERRVRVAEDAGQRDALLIEAFADAMGLDLAAPATRKAVERAFTVIDGGRAA